MIILILNAIHDSFLWMVSHTEHICCCLNPSVFVPSVPAAVWFQTHLIVSNPSALSQTLTEKTQLNIFLFYHYITFFEVVRHLTSSVSHSLPRSLMLHMCICICRHQLKKNTYMLVYFLNNSGFCSPEQGP